MRIRTSFLGGPLLALALLIPSTGRATTWDNRPKILLHLKAVTTKDACAGWGDLTDCAQAVTHGQTATAAGPFYYMYLLVAPGPLRGVELGGNGRGIAGLQCGIYYDPNLHSGLDVFGWTLCATLEFPATRWPEPGGSNLITWDRENRCQKNEVAVAGYFYCGAYGPDYVLIIPRPVDNEAKVADCLSTEIPLGINDLGEVSFTPAGIGFGCNPCTYS